MKRISILVTGLILLVSSVNAQYGHKHQDLSFKPYIGVGATLNTNVLTPGVEYGYYNDKMWFAAALSTTEVNDKQTWSLAYKNYFDVFNAGVVQNYLFYAINVSLEKGHAIGVEPGIATVFNVGKLAPQVSVSFPTSENKPGWSPLGINFGFGLNYWIR
jgi:hypothetical protein